MRGWALVLPLSVLGALGAVGACHRGEPVGGVPGPGSASSSGAAFEGAAGSGPTPVDAATSETNRGEETEGAATLHDAAAPVPSTWGTVLDERWSQRRDPAPGPPTVMGGYARGCLQGAVALPEDGTGYVVMRPSRHRFYGHPSLVSYVQRLGALATAQHLGPLFVGDLAQARGGPTRTGHASHQTGLDVDIYFLPPRAGGPLSLEEREKLPARAVVDLSTNKLTRTFHPRVLALVELAARDAVVDRIFVHAAVKKRLCATRPGAPWLGRVRPWWGHHDHFHVRLRCPAADAACEAQPALSGDGCDASLDWWLSDEAKKGPKKEKDKPPPTLPASCEPLVR